MARQSSPPLGRQAVLICQRAIAPVRACWRALGGRSPRPGRWLLAALLLAVLLMAGVPQALRQAPTASAPASPPAELRGVWLTNVSSNVLFAPWAINRAFRQLATLHFNTVYPVVWNRGHTFYPSDVSQRFTGRDQDPTLRLWRAGRDVLAEMTREGQHYGLRVIPWFEYGFMAPARSPLVRQHPHWLTQRQDGSQTVGDFEGAALELSGRSRESGWQRLRSHLGDRVVGQRVWLNPLHPEVQDFILQLVLEVVTRYDHIAGIQLDDHFGLPVEFGYDPYTVARYQLDHGGARPPRDPRDPEWVRWRADRLTAFMGRIAEAVHQARPGCIVSLSPNSQGFAYTAYLQDWSTWVERGWVDELVVQVYRRHLDAFLLELDQPALQQAQAKIPVGVGILTGSWKKPVKMAQIEQQVQAVRDRGLRGVSFFYWESLWSYLTPEAPRQRRAAFQTLFDPLEQAT